MTIALRFVPLSLNLQSDDMSPIMQGFIQAPFLRETLPPNQGCLDKILPITCIFSLLFTLVLSFVLDMKTLYDVRRVFLPEVRELRNVSAARLQCLERCAWQSSGCHFEQK